MVVFSTASFINNSAFLSILNRLDLPRHPEKMALAAIGTDSKKAGPGVEEFSHSV